MKFGYQRQRHSVSPRLCIERQTFSECNFVEKHDLRFKQVLSLLLGLDGFKVLLITEVGQHKTLPSGYFAYVCKLHEQQSTSLLSSLVQIVLFLPSKPSLSCLKVRETSYLLMYFYEYCMVNLQRWRTCQESTDPNVRHTQTFTLPPFVIL